MAGPYYIDKAVGNDANTGLSEGAGNAFETIDKYYQICAAGEIGYAKASATYTERATAVTAGTITAPVFLIGYTSVITDNGQITIDGTGSNSYGLANNNTSHYQIIGNVKVINSTGQGFQYGATDNCLFVNCVADNCAGIGFQGDNALKFIKCTSSNNSGGFSADSKTLFFGCITHGNSGREYEALSASIAINCIAYAMASNQIAFYLFDGVFNCTIDGENGATTIGVQFSSVSGDMYGAINNIIYDLNYGVYSTASNQIVPIGYNLINSINTLAYLNVAENLGGNDVTSAPDFVNEAGDDYTPNSSSPAVGAGLDAASLGMDIGAIQTVGGAGGGGGVKLVGRGGGMVA